MRPPFQASAQHVPMLRPVIGSGGLARASQAASPFPRLVPWSLLGIGGAMVLSTAAHALLSDVPGGSAPRWIAAVMRASGLSASTGLRATEALQRALGWRDTLLVFAGLHLSVCRPLHLLAVPGSGRTATAGHLPAARLPSRAIAPLRPRERQVCHWLCAAVSLTGFVRQGLPVAIVELLKSVGLAPIEALAVASMRLLRGRVAPAKRDSLHPARRHA
jgi:hypothetical protein